MFLLILGKFIRLILRVKFPLLISKSQTVGLFLSTCRYSLGLLCETETLVGEQEYRCCKELGPVQRIMVFDGSIEHMKCITEHKVYTVLTNKTVLSLVGPLLRCRNGRSYRRSANQSKNE